MSINYMKDRDIIYFEMIETLYPMYDKLFELEAEYATYFHTIKELSQPEVELKEKHPESKSKEDILTDICIHEYIINYYLSNVGLGLKRIIEY